MTVTETPTLNTPALDSATARSLGYTVKKLLRLPASQNDRTMQRAVGKSVVVEDKTTRDGDYVRVMYGKTRMWTRPADLEDEPTP